MFFNDFIYFKYFPYLYFIVFSLLSMDRLPMYLNATRNEQRCSHNNLTPEAGGRKPEGRAGKAGPEGGEQSGPGRRREGRKPGGEGRGRSRKGGQRTASAQGLEKVSAAKTRQSLSSCMSGSFLFETFRYVLASSALCSVRARPPTAQRACHVKPWNRGDLPRGQSCLPWSRVPE